MKKVIIGKKEKEIIRLVGLGILVSCSFFAPNLPKALASLLRNNSSRQNFKRSIKKMEEKGIIYLNGDKVRLTEKGEFLLNKISLEDISIDIPDEWDGIWRLISYDIPNGKKKERDYFRKKLELLNFSKVQESLYVFPYSCREEVAIFAQSLGVSPHVVYMHTDKLPRNEHFIKRYNL